jgi:hypothetical protein
MYPRAVIFVALLAGGITVAQIATSPAPPSSFFPEGAIVYIETQNLESMLQLPAVQKLPIVSQASGPP